ncbi:hypothetical protein K501DRAFT_237319 [Backusella circina FSU 941]|nr:hypothetical protein K501DRAFT_237319 [Backusella circina FSU 941]
MSEKPLNYLAFEAIFKGITHIFFREIKTTGAHLVPTSGPCIFIVSKHCNQFVDGVVFFSKNPRSSYAIMADVSYNKPLIGHVGKFLNAIPVVRPQDIVHKGSGVIFYDPENEPLLIRGRDTKFSTELNHRDFVIFGRNYKVHVEKIVSDTEMEISHSIRIEENEQHRENGYAFKIAPHVDQAHVYEEVHQYLDNNECITIFPEGGSHDRSEMLPLKAGFAVMALGAAAANPSLDIKIVPVGLNYFHPDKFRSRAVVSFGHPISLDPKDVEDFKAGGKEKRDAITKLLDKGDEAFKTVTVNTPDYETLMVIQAARRLYAPENQTKPTIDQVVKLNREFASLWEELKDNADHQAIAKKVKYYNDMLTFFGIADHQVEKLNITPLRAAIRVMKRVAKLVLMAGLGTPVLLSNLPLIWITSFISKRKQREALAGSSVKITGKDVLASWKVMVASVGAPALYGFYALIYLLYLVKRRPNLSPLSKLTRAGCAWAIQPILSYLLMRLGDTGLDIYKSIKPLFLVIRNPEAGGILRSMRKELSRDITDFINTHAPNFNNETNDEKKEEPSHLEEEETPMFQIGGGPPSSESEYNGTSISSHILIDDSSQYTESLVLESDSESQLENSQYNIETILLDSQDDSQG